MSNENSFESFLRQAGGQGSAPRILSFGIRQDGTSFQSGFPMPFFPDGMSSMFSQFSDQQAGPLFFQSLGETEDGEESSANGSGTTNSVEGLPGLHQALHQLLFQLRPVDNSTAKATLAALPRITLVDDIEQERTTESRISHPQKQGTPCRRHGQGPAYAAEESLALGHLGIKELKERLDAMGVAHASFLEKSELVAALEAALKRHDKLAASFCATPSRLPPLPTSSTSSSSKSSSSSALFDLPLNELRRRHLILTGTEPSSTVYKPELIKALRSAAGSTSPSEFSSTSTSTKRKAPATPKPPDRVPLSLFFSREYQSSLSSASGGEVAECSGAARDDAEEEEGESSRRTRRRRCANSDDSSAAAQTQNRMCTICMDQAVSGDTVTVLPGCGHFFHLGPDPETSSSGHGGGGTAEDYNSDCCPGILTWLKSHSSCPNCKAELPTEKEAEGSEGSTASGPHLSSLGGSLAAFAAGLSRSARAASESSSSRGGPPAAVESQQTPPTTSQAPSGPSQASSDRPGRVGSFSIPHEQIMAALARHRRRHASASSSSSGTTPQFRESSSRRATSSSSSSRRSVQTPSSPEASDETGGAPDAKRSRTR